MLETYPWPEGDLVDTKILTAQDQYGPLSDIWSTLNTGIKIGEGLKERYKWEDIPPEIQLLINKVNNYHHNYPQFSWYNVPPPGQAGHGKPNRYGIMIPSFWGYDDDKAALLRLEVGCKHDYRIHNQRNCYREGTCKICGYHWVCDSGD